MEHAQILVRHACGDAPLVLVVDLDATKVARMTPWLEHAGFRTRTVEDTQALRVALATTLPALVLLGVSDAESLSGLREVRARHGSVPVVVVSSAADTAIVSRAMHEGAYDYLQSDERTKLITAARNACERHRLSLQVSALKRQTQEVAFEGLLGRSPQMRQLFSDITRVAPGDASVLIHGERGTERESIARAIHGASARAAGPFVAVDCATIPEALQESTLFGVERGAFEGAHPARTGHLELAHRGTLFLDGLTHLSRKAGAKLLRVIEEGRVHRVGGLQPIESDFRVIAASDDDLRTAVARGEINEELLTRIAVVDLDVPPLRERRGDLELQLQYVLQDAAGPGEAVPRVDPDALELLRRHPWPGNVRELKDVMGRALLVGERDSISLRDLPASLRKHTPHESAANEAPSATIGEHPDQAGTLADLERQAIERELERRQGNVTAVCRALGIGRTTLYRRLKTYGLR